MEAEITKEITTEVVSTAVSFAKSAGRRHDRWENQVNRFGGENDPMTVTSFQPGIRLGRQQLDLIYEHDWASAKVIDIPAADATREWIKLNHASDPKKAEIAKKEIDRWNLQALTEESEKLARLYGGALMVIGAFDGQEPEEPLNHQTIRKINFIHVVDRFMAYPRTFFRDGMEDNFGDVETYIIHKVRVAGAITSTVHSSRVIRFEGRYVPPVRRLRNFGWQNSVLTRLYEVIRQFGVSVQSGSATLQDFVTKKLKIRNLQELVAKGDFDIITSRLSLAAREMAINNIAVYGADEEIEKMGTPITGLPKLMELFIDYLSAAADIPRSRLFQNTTGTLGGDPGKNDLRIHYDNIAAMQKNKMTRPVQQAIDIILAPLGFAPGEITFTWNSLWQMSESEKAEIELKVAQKDQIYIQMGVVEPEEVALSRFTGDETDLSSMQIDVERREKALEALSKVELIPNNQKLIEGEGPEGFNGSDRQNGNRENDNDSQEGNRQDVLKAGKSKKDASNLTDKTGADPHRHTFEIDNKGNGQTIDTLDEGLPHVHVIRTYQVFEGGADGHIHQLASIGDVQGGLTGGIKGDNR